MICSYLGKYRHGSPGAPDARYMMAMAQAYITGFSPQMLVFDLSGVAYHGGDNLSELFALANELKLPWTVVAGPDSEKAIKTLLVDESGEELNRRLFSTIETACAYLAQSVEK